ncbi:CLUMA_CG011178, isoform A [Clunio marinus]|uniref:Ribonuclease P/MRP protein subunit POP5 n=1 Tax=Clunio marinus TaxID=568069 RepID=A0A1J1IBZ0_9DIPT|nr:CLUMA_CG011178, isoform A [Clunio marinus]
MVRFKNRYILLQIKSDKKFKISTSELAGDFRRSIQKYYGDFGAASVQNLAVKYFNEKHKLVIVRLSHGPHKFLSSILPLSTKAGKELAKFQILYIGATIRQCKKYIVKHQNEFIRQTIGAFKDDSERKEFLDNIYKSLDQ